MMNTDGIDDTTRAGANSLRAEINRLRKQLSAVSEKLATSLAETATAQADAKALSEFIVSRGHSLRVWEHADVLRLFSLTVQGTILRLQAQSKAHAETGLPASHVLYRNLGLAMRKEVAEKIAELCSGGLARPDNVSEQMKIDVLKLLKLGEDKA